MARYSTAEGIRGITGEDGYGWLPGDGWLSGSAKPWIRRDHGGPVYTLEKRRRNPKDETMATGWYLYDDQPGGFFGEWCGSRILEAVDQANELIERSGTE